MEGCHTGLTEKGSLANTPSSPHGGGIGLTRGYRCRIRAQKAKKETYPKSPSGDPDEPTLFHGCLHFRCQRLSRWEIGQGGAEQRQGCLCQLFCPILGRVRAGRREQEGGRRMQEEWQSPNSLHSPRLSRRKPHPRTGHPGQSR